MSNIFIRLALSDDEQCEQSPMILNDFDLISSSILRALALLIVAILITLKLCIVL